MSDYFDKATDAMGEGHDASDAKLIAGTGRKLRREADYDPEYQRELYADLQRQKDDDNQ